MSFSFVLPWFVAFLVMLVVLMVLIRHLLKSKDLTHASTAVKDPPTKT